MRFFLFFAAIGAVICAPHSLQAALTCNEYVPAQVEVKPSFEDVTYEFHEPMLKIHEIAEEGKAGIQPESWPVGLSTGEFYLNITKKIFTSRGAYDPQSCGQIRGLRIEIGFVNNKLYVARELPKRSCPYKTVLEHEEKHKAVDRALLEEYTGKARDYFTDAAKAIGVIRNPSAGLIEGQIGSALGDAMDKFSAEMENERTKRQKEVDSAEEYARISASCDGELMQIVQDRLDLLEATHPGIIRRIEKKPPLAPPREAPGDSSTPQESNTAP